MGLGLTREEVPDGMGMGETTTVRRFPREMLPEVLARWRSYNAEGQDDSEVAPESE